MSVFPLALLLRMSSTCTSISSFRVGVETWIGWAARAIDVQMSFTGLDRLLASIAYRHVIVLAGDFNSKLQPQEGIIGQAVGSAKRTPDAELQSILVTHQLTCLNTWGRADSYTCSGPSGATSVIDFVIIRLAQADGAARAVKHLYQNPFSGVQSEQHIPLLASIPGIWQCWSQTTSSRHVQLDVDKFATDVACNSVRYQSYLQLVQREIKSLPIDELDLDLAVAKASCSMYMQESKSKSCSIIMADQVLRGWRLWKTLQSLRYRGLHDLFRAWVLVKRLLQHRRYHRAARRHRRRKQLVSFVQASAVAAEQGNQRELHRIIRMLAPKQKRQRLHLRDSNGFLLCGDDEDEAVRAHMTNLYVDEHAQELELQRCSHIPFTETDLRGSLANLPAHKATPAVCAKSIFVKFAASVIAPELYARIRRAWEGSIPLIPSSWRSSWVHWLHKPHKDASNMMDGGEFRCKTLLENLCSNVWKEVRAKMLTHSCRVSLNTLTAEAEEQGRRLQGHIRTSHMFFF